jgi:hypothetical protein
MKKEEKKKKNVSAHVGRWTARPVRSLEATTR